MGSVALVTLHAFGEARFEIGATVVTPSAVRPFACLLYLAAARGRPVARDALAAMCWPDAEAARARHALRQLLYRLRRAGVPLVEDATQVALPREAIADRTGFEPTIAIVREALASGDGALVEWLPGFRPTLSDAFTRWLETQRARVEARMRPVLDALLDEARAAGNAEAVERAARALLALDPMHRVARAAIDMLATRAGARTRLKSDDAPATRIVGRGRQLAAIERSIGDARARRGHVLVICGPSGSGRSLLLERAAVIARAERATVLAIPLPPRGVALPTLLAPVVGALLDAPGALGAAPDAIAALRAWHRAPTFVAALPTDPIGRALAELLEAIGDERPVVLLLDGVDARDAAGDALIAMLHGASRERCCVAIIAVQAGRAAQRAKQSRVDADGPLCMVLEPLGADDATRLATAVAEDAGIVLEGDDLTWCLSMGRGIPARIAACARAVVLRPGTREAPSELRERADAALASVSAPARRLASAVAMWGALATPERAFALIGCRPTEGMAALAALDALDLVDHTGGRIQLTDACVVDAALDAVTSFERSAWHRAVADVCAHALELTDSGPPERIAELAIGALEHCISSGDPDRGIAVVREAADRLLQLGFPRDAATLLDRSHARVVALAPGSVAASELVVAAADAWLLAGVHPAAAPATRGTGVVHGRPRAPLLERAWRQRPSTALLTDSRRAATDPLLSTGERMRAAVVSVACAEAFGVPDTMPDVRDAIEQCAFLVGAAADADDLPAVLRARMAYHVSLGDLALGVAAARDLETWLSTRPIVPTLLITWQNVAEAFHVAGLTGAAASAFERAYAAASQLRAAPLAARAADRLACLEIGRGSAANAERWLGESTRWLSIAGASGTADTLDTQLRWRILRGGDATVRRDATDAWLASQRGDDEAARVHRALLTTCVEAHLADDVAVPSDWLATMRALHIRMRGRTGHDRFAAAFVRVLIHAGRSAEAALCARRYVTRERRALGPAPRVLRQLVGGTTVGPDIAHGTRSRSAAAE